MGERCLLVNRAGLVCNSRPDRSSHERVMIFNLFKRNRPDPAIDRLYGDIVAAARMPSLYRDMGAPDTVMGRFEVLTLHVSLVLQRLKALPPPADALAQEVVDRFFAELDSALREIGIGDVSVPKKVKKLGEAFYGRAGAYEAALQTDAPAGDLENAIARNVLDQPDAAALAAALAQHVRALVSILAEKSMDDLAAGRVFSGRARAAAGSGSAA